MSSSAAPRRTFLFAAAVAALAAAPARAEGLDAGGEIAGELRLFPSDGRFPDQFERWQPSLTLEPDLRWSAKDRTHSIVFRPFARLDGQDGARTHFDIREGYYRYVADSGWSLTLGLAKVFWGRAESRHLVDVVNQTDAVEDIDEEDKLGQPMANLTLVNPWGVIDLFAMSGFRERTFAGRRGRPRFGFVIDSDEAIYEADGRRKAPDFAVRYSHHVGELDFGLAAFYGTSREARFAIDPAAPRLVPVYDRIFQASLDAQLTTGAWLWKAEALVREGQGDLFFAAVAGFEYTLYQLFGSGADLGLLAEYHHDGRDDGFAAESFANGPLAGPALVSQAPFTVFQNDVFAGARLALNDVQDTALLAGAIIDAQDGTVSVSAEASRRIGQRWTAELEGRFFANVDPSNIVDAFRDDDFVTLRLTRYF
jgi:hypothetical protein